MVAAAQVVRLRLPPAATPSQAYWHQATQRPAPVSRRDLEQIAFRLGCSVAAAKRAMELGIL